MILLDRVSYRYNEKQETSFKLKEVSFSCRKGLINGVIGANGSGKSTIARLIAGLIQPRSGSVTVDGLAAFNNGAGARFLAGIIFQTPENQIVGTTVAEDIAFGLENLGVPRPEMRQRVYNIAEKFELNDMLDVPVHCLSGGQKQMLCVASVMVMEPSWLIFDEPTSHLDPWTRKIFWKKIRGLVAAEKTGVLVVSQLPDDMAHFEQIFAFESGELVFSGSKNELKEKAEQLPWFNLPEAWRLEKLLGTKK
ncbi:MAG TPA: ATP-binding cassette domain-containing protein [Candidatus Rifleibacterium sp.]|nr:ATP-binding cassette domain-containing protein [Candidatus Rifleibacterium sp.]HPT46851.1 ATP-binding cassette domain-containing protein [Candidatus Rifleibacterium sp.]